MFRCRPRRRFFALPIRSKAAASLTAAGFGEPSSNVIDLRCRFSRAEDVLDYIRRSAVRMVLLLDRQNEPARQRIEGAIVEGAEAHRNADGIELRMPAVVTSAAVE